MFASTADASTMRCVATGRLKHVQLSRRVCLHGARIAALPPATQFADAQPNQAALPFSTDKWSVGQKKGHVQWPIR